MALFFGLPEWIIFAATALVLLYIYASRHRHYWKSQNIPSEPFSIVLGPTLKILFKPQFKIDHERYMKHGNFFGAFEAGKPVLFVAEPDLVKQVLVKDFAALPYRMDTTFTDPVLSSMMSTAKGDQWRKVRRAASPAFSSGKLRKMTSLVEKCAYVTLEHLKKAAANEEDIDLKQFYGNYSLDVIARCAFATELDSYSDNASEFVKKTRDSFSGRISPRIFFVLTFPRIAKLLGIQLSTSDTFEYFVQICKTIIKKRKDKKERHDDFLQLMMDAQAGELNDAVENVSARDEKLFNLGSDVQVDAPVGANKTLTEDEAVAQCVLFLIAGQDTVSTAIAHTLYLLAIHPEVQAKLRKEVDDCFAKEGEHPNLDAVSKLKYLHCVVSESLRIHPPSTRIQRAADSDYVLSHTGVKVKKGDDIAIPIYSMHRDPQYFSNPSVFDPERFNDENAASIQPYTYLPFGAGPRNCIGMRFALQAVKLSVLHTIRNVCLVRTAKTKVPLEFHRSAFLTAKDIIVGIRRRDDQDSQVFKY